MDIKRAKHIHFVGIKGVGMTALALCTQDLGIKLTGSDVEEVFVTDEILKRRKITWNIGFRKENIVHSPDLVIATGAHGGLSNIEVLVAKEKGILVVTYAEALGMFMEGKEGISVCGVGGKTTTSSIIATVLDRAGLYPSFAIGVGDIFSLGSPGRYDKKGKHFVAEADEYAVSPKIDNRPKFVFQHPKIVVVTNIEHDHPDIYPNVETTKNVFRQFFSQIPKKGLLVACLDNKNVKEVIKRIKIPFQTYGFSPRSDWFINKVSFSEGKTLFSVLKRGVSLGEFALKVPGKFNVLNVTAAIAVSSFLGLDTERIRRGLEEFRGTKRRFEFIGEIGGVKLYDDYAHHPAEIKAILEAVHDWFPKRRIIVIFQPHTYSRTKALLADFARAFEKAEMVIFADIYASARESKDPTMSAEILTAEAKKHHPQAIYGGKMEEVVEKIGDTAQKGDIILTMGAGDIFHYHQAILENLKK